MTDRPNVHAKILLGAGKRYGDACVAQKRAIYAWSRDQPHDEMDQTSAVRQEAEADLLRAARAYATRMRRKTKTKPENADD